MQQQNLNNISPLYFNIQTAAMHIFIYSLSNLRSNADNQERLQSFPNFPLLFCHSKAIISTSTLQNDSIGSNTMEDIADLGEKEDENMPPLIDENHLKKKKLNL